jgi:integrase/recombinase XerD
MTGIVAVPGETPDEVMRHVAGWLANQESPLTRAAYARDLAGITPEPPSGQRRPKPMLAPPWLEWCRSLGIDPLSDVTPDHVAVYARTLEASGLARTSRARKLSAVSSWYSHLTERGVIPASPARIKRPKVNRDARVAPSLTREQAQALLAAADSSPGPQRARTSALTATLLFTGARVSEVIGADTDDIGVDRGVRVLWVTRKGGKRQALLLPGPVASRIDAYLAGRGDLSALPVSRGQAGLSRHPVLFAAGNGKRLRAPDVWKLVRRLGKRAGFPPELVNHLGPHSMRATFITLSLDAGVPLRDVQDAAGHISADTTRGYDRSRHNLDRAPGWALAAYLSASPPQGQ